jgi:hypothetical protein
LTIATIVQEPAEKYHANPALSRSRLWQFCKSRREYERNAPLKANDNLRLGTFVHSLLLEDRPCAVAIPQELLSVDGAARTKAAKEWRAEREADGLIVLPADEIAKGEAMAASVRNRLGSWLDLPSKREASIYWHDDRSNLDLRVRPDWIIDNGKTAFVLDLKTTESVEPMAFRKSVIDYGYHLQAVMYSDGVEAAIGKETEFYFVGVEKEPPYVCSLRFLDRAAIQDAWGMYRKALISLRECLDSGNFADWHEDQVVSISLPEWAFNLGGEECQR